MPRQNTEYCSRQISHGIVYYSLTIHTFKFINSNKEQIHTLNCNYELKINKIGEKMSMNLHAIGLICVTGGCVTQSITITIMNVIIISTTTITKLLVRILRILYAFHTF